MSATKKAEGRQKQIATYATSTNSAALRTALVLAAPASRTPSQTNIQAMTTVAAAIPASALTA